jgi:hypothetical protein
MACVAVRIISACQFSSIAIARWTICGLVEATSYCSCGSDFTLNSSTSGNP